MHTKKITVEHRKELSFPCLFAGYHNGEKRPYHSVRVSLRCKMKRVMTMVKVLQTYLTENDFLSRLRRLETRGCSFVPMTTDEIALAEHLCNKGVLHHDGIGVHLAPCPQPLIPTRYA